MNKKKNDKGKHKNEMNAKDFNETEIPITDSTEENTETETESTETEQVSKLKDQLLRKAAEFENYKRRTESERGDYFAYANEKLISDLLPVLDDFERALKAYDKNHDTQALKKGVELVNDKFRNILEKQGLKEMDSTGKEFDVNKHDALMQQPSDEVKPNTVIDTIEKGYNLKDKVLRHAKVIVSAKPE